MKRFAKSVLGVTLLEIMLVLAVAAMIIVMSVRYYQSASASEQANTILEMVQAITAAADGIAQPVGSYSGATTAAISPMMPNQSMSTVWGGTVTIDNGDSTTYVVTITDMPSAVCNIFRPKLMASTKYTSVASCPAAGSTGSLTYTYNSTK